MVQRGVQQDTKRKSGGCKKYTVQGWAYDVSHTSYLRFKVPIMLVVRNAKNASTPAANRVDVIAPSVVGQDLWRALVFGGARAVGLNDHRVLNFESSLLSFPDDVPDCRAGQDANKEEAEKLEVT